MTQIRNALFLLLLTQCCAVEQPLQTANPQRKLEVSSGNFFGLTNDVIYWEGVEYMCSESPLSEFDGYKTIFGELESEQNDPESPVDLDKNYKVKWIIKDRTLFLHDVEILNKSEKYRNKRKVLEKLTKRKFEKNLNLFPEIPEGVIFASWFSGEIYLKRQPAQGETYCDCMYRCENFIKLTFQDGKLAFKRNEDVHSMHLLVDSVEIYNNPKKYSAYKNPFLKKMVFDRDICKSLISEKLSLEDNQYIYQGYHASCNDKILWHDTTFFIEKSPLSFFKNYKEIYPNVPQSITFVALPYRDEKNYVPKWVIVNDMLYLYDINFLEGNHEFNNEYLIRFQPIEKLTGKKFQQTPYVNVKVIFANWFNGVMYLKRYPEKDESPECEYKCEPFYKLTLENGKIVSKEKTNYMILKRNTE